MDLGSILSGPIGAITGAVGAIGSKYLDYKMEQVKNEHELAMEDKRYQASKMETEAKGKIAETEAETQKLTKDLETLTASLQADKAGYGESILGRIVDFARGVTRPLITFLSMSLVIYMSSKALRTSMAQGDALEILRESLFLSGVSISWWFGTRPNRK